MKSSRYKESLEPKFYSDNSSFRVTLYNLNYNVPVEKVDIDDKKVDIGIEKVDFKGGKVNIELIETALTERKVNLPTKDKAKEVFLHFRTQTVFSRKEVAELLEISPTSASNLLGKMDKAGLLESVVGQGKGKYRFK